MCNLFNGRRRALLRRLVEDERACIERSVRDVKDFIDGKAGKAFLFPYRDEGGILRYFWVTRRALLKSAHPTLTLYDILTISSQTK